VHPMLIVMLSQSGEYRIYHGHAAASQLDSGAGAACAGSMFVQHALLIVARILCDEYSC
jgi:acyl-coenzyme A thioesterase PaaI-like protein